MKTIYLIKRLKAELNYLEDITWLNDFDDIEATNANQVDTFEGWFECCITAICEMQDIVEGE